MQSVSEDENYQDIVPVEIESENQKIQTSIRAPAKSIKFSNPMRETLGALMNCKNFQKLYKMI